MSVVLVVAPHGDDETLGCGGTLLRHRDEGDEVHWLVMTTPSKVGNFNEDTVQRRQDEIGAVSRYYSFASTNVLDFIPARLDTVPMADMVQSVGETVSRVQAETLYLPFAGDAHSDHGVTFEVVMACTKWFRHETVKNVFVYETLSETDQGSFNGESSFNPALYVDISRYLGQKVDAMRIYAGEMSAFPFPRSEEALRAQAALRGAAVGCEAAEAFMVRKMVR